MLHYSSYLFIFTDIIFTFIVPSNEQIEEAMQWNGQKAKYSLVRNVYCRILLFIFFIIPNYFFGAHALLCKTNEICLDCHSDSALTGKSSTGEEISFFVSPTAYKASVHGEMECIECHQDLEKVKDFPHNSSLKKVDCGTCHDDVTKEYQQSLHAYARASGNIRIPTCSSCHGVHDIFSSADPNSKKIYRLYNNTSASRTRC